MQMQEPLGYYSHVNMSKNLLLSIISKSYILRTRVECELIVDEARNTELASLL